MIFNALRHWFACLRHEHAFVTLVTLRTEILFVEAWLFRAKQHAAQREHDVERLRRDVHVSESLWSLERRAR